MLTRPFNSGRDTVTARTSGAKHPAHRRRELPRGDVNRMLKAFAVKVDNKLWGRFGDRETAERVAARLRQLGMAAKVEGADECET